MTIVTLPNGFVLDMEQIQGIENEFLRVTDWIQSLLVIKCDHATVKLFGTKAQIIDTRNQINEYLKSKQS